MDPGGNWLGDNWRERSEHVYCLVAGSASEVARSVIEGAGFFLEFKRAIYPEKQSGRRFI